jgi:hypothetical protein
MADTLLIAASASAVGGSAVLRYAWSLPRRSTALNGVGWGLFLAGIIAGWWSAGAWGTTIVSLFGIGAALLFLGHAAATAPAANARASNRRVNMLPEHGEPLHLARRFMTFCIVAIAALIVSVGLGVATHSLMAWAGAVPANAIVAGFFMMPLAWGLLAYTLLMEERRTRQWAMLGILAVPGALAVFIGLSA